MAAQDYLPSLDLRHLPKAVCALLAVAVFGLVGPPVGGLVAWATMGAPTLRSPLPFVTGSFGEGVILALATGILVAVAAWFGKTSWLVAVAAAILANLTMHVTTAILDPANPDDLAAVLRVAWVFLPPSIVAAIVCWLLTRRMLRS